MAESMIMAAEQYGRFQERGYSFVAIVDNHSCKDRLNSIHAMNAQLRFVSDNGDDSLAVSAGEDYAEELGKQHGWVFTKQSCTGTPEGAVIGTAVRYDLLDYGVKVSDRAAFAACRAIAKHMGLLLGGSAGGAVVAALEDSIWAQVTALRTGLSPILLGSTRISWSKENICPELPQKP